MNEKRHTVRCAVYAFFVKEHKILLVLRKGTGWMDGNYGLPAGHFEKGEELKTALIREVSEEVGIVVDSANLTLYHVMHRNEKKIDNFEYVDFFFKVEYWEGEPKNNEPGKAEEVKWFDLDSLPKNMVPNVKAGINYYRSKIFFSEFS
jgi:8-oxo-dGTP pyrophosphatase MutT (NUDIX family)